MRFGLCVNSWRHPLAAPIAALAPALAPASRLGLSQRGLAPGGAAASGAPFVYVAAGHQEVGLWDLLDCQCHQVGGDLSQGQGQDSVQTLAEATSRAAPLG